MGTQTVSMVTSQALMRDVSSEAITMDASQKNQMELKANSSSPSYHEVPKSAAMGMDVLVQLKANMNVLEDLHSRLRFMMNEVSYLIKK